MSEIIDSIKNFIDKIIKDLSVINIVIIVCLSYIIANIISILNIRINYTI